MKNFKYMFFMGVVLAVNASARDAYFYKEELDHILVCKSHVETVLDQSEFLVYEPEPVPSSYQIVCAENNIDRTIEDITLLDIFSGLVGRSSSKLDSWSSEKVVGFMEGYNQEYTELGISQKRRKLINLQRELENVKASKGKKKKKGKKAKIAELERKISVFEEEISDFLWFQDARSLEKIKLCLVSKVHDYPWAFSVKLALASEEGIPERFLGRVKASLEYFVDI